MERRTTGQYKETVIGGEVARAFVPDALPPRPALDLAVLQTCLERALLALDRLDSLSRMLPDTHIFLYAYVRKEAVLSSQIEGTQSSLSDLLLFELAESPGVPFNDVTEVSHYVAALDHGLKRLHDGFPLCNRLLREMHGILMSGDRGGDKRPGEFRRSQNWIGGTRPRTAHFVPPPAVSVPDCMSDLERFFNQEETGLPLLLRAGLAHVQFETIHPFLDGNGRIGRLLITLILHHGDVLQQPLLYLSLYFKQHRETYYALLDNVRRSGNWEQWLDFFLDGVTRIAEGAVTTAKQLLSLFQEDQERIRHTGRGWASALHVHLILQERPIASLQQISDRANLSFPATSAGMKVLENLGIATEVTGNRRNRRYSYSRYLEILAEGTEPL